MRTLLIKASSSQDVRISKYIQMFNRVGDADFIGWDRLRERSIPNELHRCEYILSGFGYSNWKLLVGYPLWFIQLFLTLIKKDLSQYNFIYTVDFESSLVVCMTSYLKKIHYIYDIYDEFAIRYKVWNPVKAGLQAIDRTIKKRAHIVIHVDENRAHNNEQNYIIIPNSPFDYYGGNFSAPEYRDKLAVTGWLTKSRGLDSIYRFAKTRYDIQFVVIGVFPDAGLKHKFTGLPNATVHDFLPQERVFALIRDCSGIFSLYDPAIEINRKAASNKLFDAMMLGIPAITNSEIESSSFVMKKEIGIAVNYHFDDSWQRIDLLLADRRLISAIGGNGRRLYERCYKFETLFNTKLLPVLRCLIQPN